MPAAEIINIGFPDAPLVPPPTPFCLIRFFPSPVPPFFRFGRVRRSHWFHTIATLRAEPNRDFQQYGDEEEAC
jgi:hypothetical protein